MTKRYVKALLLCDYTSAKAGEILTVDLNSMSYVGYVSNELGGLVTAKTHDGREYTMFDFRLAIDPVLSTRGN